ncbi:MAG: MFS transporter [Candidatus Gracilibacteria bacterium]|nr:MFS transporter [Candidatus Gracilibacteria bacterium]
MNKKLIVLLFSIFLDILGFSFILPIIPFIIEGFGGNSFTIGLIISATAIGMFLGGIIFGKLSDKFGRKNILIFTILLNIIGYLIFGFSSNIYIFFIARFLCGLGGGGVSVVQAYISDISNDDERIVNMGYIGASIGLGFTLGPIFGTLLSGKDLKQMGFISAFILSLSLISVVIFLTNSKPDHAKEEKLSIKGSSINLLSLFVTFFGVTATFAGIQTIFALFLNNIFALNTKQIGLTFGYIGIIAIIYQILFIKHVYRKIGEIKMIIAGLVLISIGLFAIGLNSNIYLLYFILIIFTVGLSNTNSAIYSLITHYSHKKDFGKNLGLNTAFGSMADIAGPLVAGTLYLIGKNLPFYFFGVLLILNIFFLLRLKK